jgi:hypothetical protein
MPSLKMPRPEKKISGSFCSFARIPMKRYALHRISCLPNNNNNNNSQSGIDAIKSSFSRDPSNYHQPPRTRNRDGQAS